MAQLDNDIGLVMQKLKDMGEDDNTIVVFTTDNGTELFTWPDGGTTPFAQCKGTVMEGGFRVPCILRWPGHVPADSVQNGIFSGLDWFPTFLAAAGNPDITEQLLKGVKLGDRTYKNHLDGYNQMDAITGKGPSARHEIFYLGESTVGAVRIDDYKFRFIDQPDGWLGEKTHPDVPYITNLRLDPFERMGWPGNGTKDGAQQYFDWFKFQFWRFVFVQQVMGKEIQTFLDYPPMQRGASFNLDAMKAEMAKRMARGGEGEPRPQRLTGMTFTAGGSQGPPASCQHDFHHHRLVRLCLRVRRGGLGDADPQRPPQTPPERGHQGLGEARHGPGRHHGGAGAGPARGFRQRLVRHPEDRGGSDGGEGRLSRPDAGPLRPGGGGSPRLAPPRARSGHHSNLAGEQAHRTHSWPRPQPAAKRSSTCSRILRRRPMPSAR